MNYFKKNKTNRYFNELIQKLRKDCPSNFFDKSTILYKDKEIFPYSRIISKEQLLIHKDRPVITSGEDKDNNTISVCILIDDCEKIKPQPIFISSLKYNDLGSYLLDNKYVRSLLSYKSDFYSKTVILRQILVSKKYDLYKHLLDEDFIISLLTSKQKSPEFLGFLKYSLGTIQVNIDTNQINSYYQKELFSYFL